MTCLAKDPDERWQTATDLRRELQWVRDGSFQEDTPSATGEIPPRRHSVGWGAALAAAVLLTAIGTWQLAPRETTSGVLTRTTIELAANQRLDFSGGADPLAISPDGNRLVYAASEEGRLQLYVRELDAFDATPIAGTDGAQYPFFSPDGLEVAFLADGTLQRVPVGARGCRSGLRCPNDRTCRHVGVRRHDRLRGRYRADAR